jgi:hypothetical protein
MSKLVVQTLPTAATAAPASTIGTVLEYWFQIVGDVIRVAVITIHGGRPVAEEVLMERQDGEFVESINDFVNAKLVDAEGKPYRHPFISVVPDGTDVRTTALHASALYGPMADGHPEILERLLAKCSDGYWSREHASGPDSAWRFKGRVTKSLLDIATRKAERFAAPRNEVAGRWIRTPSWHQRS